MFPAINGGFDDTKVTKFGLEVHRVRKLRRAGASLVASFSIVAVLTLTGQNAALACSNVSGKGAILSPEVSTCLNLWGSDFTLHMPLHSCLVQADNNPIQFYVAACKATRPNSCKTDLEHGRIVHYERRGGEVVPSPKPCSGSH